MGTGSAAFADPLGRDRPERPRLYRRRPDPAEIAGFLGRPAKTPIRVYAGLNTAEDPGHAGRARARGADPGRRIRAGGAGGDGADRHRLDGPRSDQHAGIPARRRHRDRRGAIFLPHEQALDPGRAGLQRRDRPGALPHRLPALDQPAEGPPAEALSQGLSLGAYGSEQSFRLHEVLADPFNGAVWSGPPFSTPGWGAATGSAIPGRRSGCRSIGDSSIIRFTNQENALDIPGAIWGPMRIVYLQYASDPITFFDPHSFYRKPDWMPAARPGRLAGAALVSGRHLPPARARHGDRARGADRPRPLLSRRSTTSTPGSR